MSLGNRRQYDGSPRRVPSSYGVPSVCRERGEEDGDGLCIATVGSDEASGEGAAENARGRPREATGNDHPPDGHNGAAIIWR
jgi:hypothetical protein